MNKSSKQNQEKNKSAEDRNQNTKPLHFNKPGQMNLAADSKPSFNGKYSPTTTMVPVTNRSSSFLRKTCTTKPVFTESIHIPEKQNRKSLDDFFFSKNQ